MKRTDFRCSDIRWVTASEKSHGAFQLESILRVQPKALASVETYALGTAVLAGNMYADKKLAKYPPYMFQIAIGLKDHKIFRTELSLQGDDHKNRSKGKQTISDSSALNSEIFEQIALNIKTEYAIQVQGFDDIFLSPIIFLFSLQR